jgi:hypothetical protein
MPKKKNFRGVPLEGCFQKKPIVRILLPFPVQSATPTQSAINLIANSCVLPYLPPELWSIIDAFTEALPNDDPIEDDYWVGEKYPGRELDDDDAKATYVYEKYINRHKDDIDIEEAIGMLRLAGVR